jgi:energy-coupling factor transporter ATP-binding protein EcfA2
MWLAKRAAKTEIWLPDSNCSPTRFKVVTRPSRPLSTVIVEDGLKEELRADAIRFLQGEKWYVRKGIPYRRGFLLHGPPGCGKTSLITALAGSLRLPIVLVTLNSQGMSDSTLLGALSEAPRDAIVLIEDVDCAFASKKLTTREMMMGREAITLSGLLNAVDGVAAQEGRLLFMTTNHIERLDAALIRPGRVDVQYHLGNASKSAAGELFDQFFMSSEPGGGKTNDENVLFAARCAFLAEVENYLHSFAKLQGVMMKARDEPEFAAEEMRKLVLSINSSPPEAPNMESAIDASPPEASDNEAKDRDFFVKLQGVMMKASDEPEVAAEEMRTLATSVNEAEAPNITSANDASPPEVSYEYVVSANVPYTHNNASEG